MESDLRFYAAFFVAYGVVLLRLAPRAERERIPVRAVAGVLFLAGIARALAWIAEGRPDGGQVVLLAIELVLPPILVVWQSRLRATPSRSPARSR